MRLPSISSFFFFNDTATTEIYTLSLHDALPILADPLDGWYYLKAVDVNEDLLFSNYAEQVFVDIQDRKSTRLNSSHQIISYAVFCLKKKKVIIITIVMVSYLDYYSNPLLHPRRH